MIAKGSDQVRVTRERVVIPTYEVGEPDRNPMFLDKRVYQGSCGAVYPYPVIDTIADTKRDIEWDAVILENEYLKIMVLPALGGRVQMAYDKSNDYHFVYHNRVIKPALVGLAGPWISGGIEFNWPQHHRPNTYGPVDSEIERHEDGSATVWCHEIDRMYGTRGTHGLRLRPGKAYLEIDVRLHNRTSLPQTFLWWANPACAADEHHQSMFPPDVHAVMDHGKRDVSDFPIATGEYYKVDYSPGTDISRYRNIPVPTSYMAYHSEYNYVGSYDWAKGAGLLHVANRHVSPGKKQWTWGHGDFGQAWDRHLTDDDGPYIELMCGVYTDNQPDFTWLLPGEEKSFVQHFMPYKGVGRLGDATIDGCVGLEITERDGVRTATARAYVTSVRTGCRLEIRRAMDGDRSELGPRGNTGDAGDVLASKVFDATPAGHQELSVEIGETAESALCVVLLDASGELIVEFRADVDASEPIPDAAQEIGPPESLDSCESLYLAARHLEQYRHATRDPEPYLREALRRDPGDSRSNTALGQMLLRRGLAEEAAACFRTAIKRLTRHNPNPVTGEAHLGLGLALSQVGRDEEAEAALWKATWNEAEQPAAFFELARLRRRSDLSGGSHDRRTLTTTLGLLDRCLARNADHHQAVHLRVATLFDLGRDEDAIAAARAELARDPFAFGVLWELASRGHESWETYDRRSRGDALTALAVAMDDTHAGMADRARGVLERCLGVGRSEDGAAMLRYHLASILRRGGDAEAADEQLSLASEMPRTRCFPNRIEDISVLQEAIDQNPGDALAPFALGNLLYNRTQHERAMACWAESTRRDPSFATPQRNLGFAMYNIRGDGDAALRAYEKAFELNRSDARVLYELDQLAKRLRCSPEARLERLERHAELCDRRDDLAIERISILNRLGRHEEALQLILGRNFRPWEGGEGKVPAQFVFAATSLASAAIGNGRFELASELLGLTDPWPESLGEGKLAGIQENDIQYLMGLASRGLGRDEDAEAFFERASRGLSEPTSVMFYNDQPPEMIYYQGLALHELGRPEEATDRFDRLIAYGRAHLDDRPEIDYFAVSLPDFLVFEPDLSAQNEAHCRLMIALGLSGKGLARDASEEFERVLEIDPSHPLAARSLRDQRHQQDGISVIDVKPGTSTPRRRAGGGPLVPTVRR